MNRTSITRIAFAVAVLVADPLFAGKETVNGVEWMYEVIDGEAEITSVLLTSGSVSVPSTLGGYPVTRIKDYVFQNCHELTDVIIPNCILSIGAGAFSCCYGLTNVTMGSGVTSIGDSAFYGCSGLSSVTIPDSVSFVGNAVFCYCSGLLSVTISDGVTSIGDSAFDGCGGLKTVKIGNCVTNIGVYAFYECSNLTSVSIPKSVASIGQCAFEGCSGLKSLVIPDSVVTIGDNAFSGCSGLTSVTIGDGVRNIGYCVFSACSAIKNVTVSQYVLNQGINRVFDGSYESITNVSYTSIVTNISDFAFSCCSSLANVTIPDSVKSIGEDAFYGCRGLLSVTIPLGVMRIGPYAFAECSKLSKVKMPKISISDSVFKGCPTSLTIVYWESLLTLKPNLTKYGTMNGAGLHAIGSAVKIEARARDGYVFVGWFADKACTKALNLKGYDNRSPMVKITMPAKNTTIYAKFVTVAEAKKSLKFTSATKKLAKTAAKATAGAAFSLKLGFSSASLPTVAAKGLPKGLSIDNKTGEITGTATVPGSYTATVTVKDAAGNKITQKVKIAVAVPSWAKGTFYGTVRPGKSSDPTGYLKFTVSTTGKVSGKVTYRGKGYSFTSAYKSCTATKAAFAPKVKIGKATFKPGTVAVKTWKTPGLSLFEAANSKGTFVAQKKPGLVKKGKALAALVGKTFTFTRKDSNSGLTKKKDELTVKFGNGDAATLSGTVNGKKMTALSWALLASDKETVDGVSVYTLYVDIIDAALKYERTLVITATVDAAGKVDMATEFM